jgi:hypothetical protein
MKALTASMLLLLTNPVLSYVVFSVSSEPGGQGLYKSWVVERWKCTKFDVDIDKQASWAFVAAGLANGCELYE